MIRHRPMRGRLVLMAAMLLTPLFSVAAAAPAAAQDADRVLEDGESFPDGFTVPAGEVWEFNPNDDVKVTTSDNVIVLGTLRMKPASADYEHFLQFTGIDESQFVGGGMTHVDAPEDIGLWVEDAGRLDIVGSEVVPWSYDWEDGWEAAHDIKRVPNASGNTTSFPQVDGPGGDLGPNALGYEAEMLNLTRNVRIEGTAGGRTHVLIHAPNATGPQTIKYATIRHVAPDFDETTSSTGRYGIHFHHNQDGSRGSIVEGVVVRDAGSHAFVPHASHGITLKNTISFNTKSEAYWWDPSNGTTCDESNPTCNESDDILYDSIVAANVTPNPFKKHRAFAVQLGGGNNLTIVNSVVVGMGSTGADNAAYGWVGEDRGVWTYVNNIAHNNRSHGIFVWQNTAGDPPPEGNHVIDGFTAYYNEKPAIDHGAYNNSYVYRNLTLLENAYEVHSRALGKASLDGTTDTQVWAGVDTDGGTMVVAEHNNTEGSKAVRFEFCDFGLVEFQEKGHPGKYDFVECDLELSDFDRTEIHAETVIRVQDGNSAYTFTGNGGSTSIPTFVGNPTPPPPPGGNPPVFIDTNGNIFEADIEWLAAEGITKGCNPPDNTMFCPNEKVTRGQMAAFLNRALDLPDGFGNPFVDDDGNIFEDDIEALAASGVTKGCNPPMNDKYCPSQFVTRGQMAAFLNRAYDLPLGVGNPFVDDNGSIFEDDIEALAASGVTKGCNPPANDRFCPSQFVTRGQMAAFLHRAYDFLP
jgi:hypothetical protein